MHCRVEIGILAFCIVYIVNIFIGRRANAGVAKAWAKEFLGSNGIFDRNFALVGTGNTLDQRSMPSSCFLLPSLFLMQRILK